MSQGSRDGLLSCEAPGAAIMSLYGWNRAECVDRGNCHSIARTIRMEIVFPYSSPSFIKTNRFYDAIKSIMLKDRISRVHLRQLMPWPQQMFTRPIEPFPRPTFE